MTRTRATTGRRKPFWWSSEQEARPSFVYRPSVPSQTFEASATTSASPSAIWEQFQIPSTWEGITGVDEVLEPELDDDRLTGFEFASTAAGKRYIGRARLGESSPGESLKWDITTTEIRGWIRVDLAREADGTRISVAMRVESVSVMAAFGFPLIAGAIASGFQETVDEFAAGLAS